MYSVAAIGESLARERVLDRAASDLASGLDMMPATVGGQNMKSRCVTKGNKKTKGRMMKESEQQIRQD